jgi:lysophospholipase L1-like esterase
MLRAARRWPGTFGRWAVGVFLFVAVVELGFRVYLTWLSTEGRLHTRIFRHDPYTGFATAPNLLFHFTANDLDFTFDTNDRGLRGRQPVPAKASGEYRILVLGDSFTFGIGVESDQTFSALLQRRLEAGAKRPVTVINAGTNSYGTAQELQFLKHYGIAMLPDLVIVAYYENDMSDNGTQLEYVDGFVQRDPMRVLNHTSFVLEFVRNGWSGGHSRLDPAQLWRITHEFLAQTRHVCGQHGVAYLLLQIPGRETTKWALSPRERPVPFRRLDTPAETTIQIHSIIQALGRSPYLPEHHFNRLGHELVADKLAAEIVARGLLRPRAP